MTSAPPATGSGRDHGGQAARGPAATLHRIWAVAALTLKEAVRRKVFILLILFAAAMVSSAAFFPTIDPQARLRLIEVWSVRAALLFSVIISIFLAGFSLPADFETRRVYTLVTKPLHRMTLFLGKFAGFFVLLAVFLGLMAVLSVVYIRAVAAFSEEFPPLVAEPRYIADAVVGKAPFSRVGADRLGIVGWQDGALTWTFRGLDRSRFPERLKVKLNARLGRRGQQFAIEGRVALRAVDPASGEVIAAPVDPSPLEPLNTNQLTTLEFNANVLEGRDALQFRLQCAEPDVIVDAEAGGLVLYGKSRNFELNYLRGMMLVLFQATVVMALTLAASTQLSAPVSIFAGIGLYIVGMLWGQISEGVVEIDAELEQVRAMLAQGQTPPRPPEELPPWLLQMSSAVSGVVLKVIPDFGRFSFSDYLLNDHAVMGRDLAQGFLAMAPRVAALLVIGLLGMLFRDFSS